MGLSDSHGITIPEDAGVYPIQGQAIRAGFRRFFSCCRSCEQGRKCQRLGRLAGFRVNSSGALVSVAFVSWGRSANSSADVGRLVGLLVCLSVGLVGSRLVGH